MSESDEDDIIKLLVQHEKALAAFYDACRRAFPEMEQFWKAIWMEEKAHAEVLVELGAYLMEEKISLAGRKFNRIGLHTALDHVNKQTQRVESGACTVAQAMAIALDIERAMIEKDAFQVFETDSPKMKREFEALVAHTTEHAARIADKLDELRS